MFVHKKKNDFIQQFLLFQYSPENAAETEKKSFIKLLLNHWCHMDRKLLD